MNEEFEKHIEELDENCICEDCGETENLCWGVCLVCGGDVIQEEEAEDDE
jgi:hypothetical protein